MHIIWGFLPLVLLSGAATAGAVAVTRYEMNSGKALRFFIPYEPWSRVRSPALFKIRQAFNLLFAVFVGLGFLAFLIQFLGIIHAEN